ncbi:RNA polymerase I 49 kDa subunit [Phaffia rhodozyma]|uniref:RNA polymerase I 49 kDa subunit n=1 Tax=Phaffia rhodozyma TaxID=264483 RepID=A0A0F7SYP1_PHARH|nr:RNA polymerase I 49 kDa subunit [Phaffia rhodozyma]
MASNQPYQTAPASTQKRKKTSDSSVSASSPASKKLQISFNEASQLGPVFANFPSIVPPTTTPFKLYRHKDSDTKKPLEEQLTILAGETAGVELYSTNRDVPVKGNPDGQGGYPCKYLIGIHDPSTSTLTLAPTPTYLLAHSVKRLKQLDSSESTSANFKDQRNKLGEAFGTKKAKSRIKAVERNLIDTSQMEDVRVLLQDSIQQSGAALPTQETIKAVADQARPIPPPNMEATTPEEAYKLEDIIPASCSVALRPLIKEIIGAENDQTRMTLLPFRHSSWVNRRMRDTLLKEKPSKEKLKILLYILLMRKLMITRRDDLTDIGTLTKKFAPVPRVVVMNLKDTFTETPRGAKAATITPGMEAKLHSWMLCLCLMYDNFICDAPELAKDLNMAPTKVNALLGGLGCKIEIPNAVERERLGISYADAKATKKAILKVPLVFKEPSRGGKKK